LIIIASEPYYMILSTQYSLSNEFYSLYNIIYRESHISFQCYNKVHICCSNSGTLRVIYTL